MKFCERAMKGLIEESQDLQSGAMRDAQASRQELRDIGASRAGQAPDLDRIRDYSIGRRNLLKTGGFGLGVLATGGLLGTAFGQRVSAVLKQPTQTDTNVDVQIFQTAASLENLAVATYGAALTLPFILDNAVVKAFAETTMQQHAEHGAAFNAQAADLGGARQTATNPKYTPIVEDAKAGLTDALAVVTLAATLEEVATDTYLANLTMLSEGNMRTLMASVMGVESQHLATLRAVGALLEGGAPQLIAIPTDVAALPAAAGSLEAVPPAVAEFATTVEGLHQAALDAWNGVLTASGQSAVTSPPAALEATVNGMFATVTDVIGAAELALRLEQITAATYLDAIGKLESDAAIALAGSIQPIDRQHIAVLLFVLGMYPVPETFATVDMAFDGGVMMPDAMPATS